MWGAIGAVGKFFGFLIGLIDWRKRKAHERLGRQAEQIDQWKRARNAEKDMDSIEPPSRDDIVDRLRKGEF